MPRGITSTAMHYCIAVLFFYRNLWRAKYQCVAVLLRGFSKKRQSRFYQREIICQPQNFLEQCEAMYQETFHKLNQDYKRNYDKQP